MASSREPSEPEGYRVVRDAMRDFPSGASMALPGSQNVRHVIVHLRGFGPNRRQALEERLPGLAPELRVSARFDDDLALELIRK